MRPPPPTVLFAAGLAVAAALLLWPMRSSQATWTVTVGDRPAKTVGVAGGAWVSPATLLASGVPEDQPLVRSAVRRRVGLAVGSLTLAALGAALARREKPPAI